jgi:muramoyltetrapeptide carboxypeptidase
MALKKIQPPFLKTADEVAIVSPSWAIEGKRIYEAVAFLETWGLKVKVGQNVFKNYGPFAGTDKERVNDLQTMTDDTNIKAVFCSRGGYGLLKIIDRIDFSALKNTPKWYIGFSDITVLHLWLSEVCEIMSVHGEMPLNFADTEKTPETFESLKSILFGDFQPYVWEGDFLRPKSTTGEITGGNLSLLYSLMGTPAEPSTDGKILFIEEVGEYYYHLDRMMTSLKLAGKLKHLSALVAGGLNKMEDGKTVWGKSAKATISDIVSEYDYPVFFDFPAGHLPDNRALIIGKMSKIDLQDKKAMLTFI